MEILQNLELEIDSEFIQWPGTGRQHILELQNGDGLSPVCSAGWLRGMIGMLMWGMPTSVLTRTTSVLAQFGLCPIQSSPSLVLAHFGPLNASELHNSFLQCAISSDVIHF